MKLRVLICSMAAGAALFAGEDPTTPTFGMIRVTDTGSTNTVIGVPWVDIASADANVTLSNLVSTANLQAGDTVYLYEGNKWSGWSLTAGGIWDPLTTVNGGAIVSPTSADAKRLARGTGMIIQRANSANPIYLCGRVASSGASATSIGANSLTLIANPNPANYSIPGSVGANGDEIRVPQNGGGLKIYQKVNDVWGTYRETKTTKRGKDFITQTWTEGCTLAPGMGAWYVSGASSTSIPW